jgi:hypothetical protein
VSRNREDANKNFRGRWNDGHEVWNRKACRRAI